MLFEFLTVFLKWFTSKDPNELVPANTEPGACRSRIYDSIVLIIGCDYIVVGIKWLEDAKLNSKKPFLLLLVLLVCPTF